MFVIHANLDAEARWAGGSLPAKIATRVSYYAALLSVLAPSDADVEVWAPAAIDASRFIASPTWKPPTMRIGTPPRADLVWAQPGAKAANDRRLALAIAREIDAGSSTCASLPRAAVIESLDELVAWTSLGGRWVAKAPWTTAGRDRCHGDGPPTDEQHTRLSRLLAKFGALVVEPWVDRILDVGFCARVGDFDANERVATVAPRGRIDASASGSAASAGGAASSAGDASPGADFYVSIADPHSIITDTRGSFLGIDLARPDLLDLERMHLGVTAREVGARLADLGFRGAFAIDAFVYRDASGDRKLRALCEINARNTFGHVARAFGARGHSRLGFSEPPADATVLVAPANDGVTAWVA